MKIENINSTNFNSRIRTMSPQMKADIQSILYRMNLDATHQVKGDYIETSLVTKLIDKNNNVFTDERRFRKLHPFTEQMKGFSNLKMGKSFVDFDNEACEITDYSKPFFKPWFVFKKEIEKCLDNFRTNLKDVRIETLNIRDLTPDGQKRLKKYVLEFEKKRLEQITKELEQCN